ncbi:MAG: YcaO-like family protein [Desulfocapsaceae bacterium]|jgi:ribosomal protein S12 methylthiotransferase accessory factor|nr:YcaO-like family protein [Desulfocapsaceae bacterium]
MNERKITFQNCFKTFTRDQDKAIAPEETLTRFYQKIDQFDCKILSEVKRIDNGRLDIPVYFSVCTDEARTLTGTKKQMGKGASSQQAKASACMELAERFSFFAFKSDENNFIRGDYKTMRESQFPVIDPSYLLKSVDDENMSPAQLEKLLEGIPMQWTWATHINTDELVLVPFSWFYAINEFNGPSAGNTIEEAALQGISEVVERHVCSKINQHQLETPLVDQESVNDPVARELLEKFKKNNIELYLSDFSLDTGICTVGALAIDRKTFPESSEIVFTAGTTPGPDKAIIRAVTEVAQLAGDFNSGANYVASGLPKPRSMAEVAYITNSSTVISTSEMAEFSDNNIKAEIDQCREALSRIGLEIFMIDVTHPGLEIPALYTIIPGAHFRERSVRKDAGLFAAKLLHEQVDDVQLFNKILAEMETLLPESYYLAFYRGISYFNQTEYDHALTHFDIALDRNPEAEDLPYILSYKGHSLKDLGRFDEAISALQRGCKADDERPDIYNLLGVCYFKKQQYEQAIHCFEKAVYLNPSSAMDYANLGVNHNRLGNGEEAIRYFTLALTMDPTLDFARTQLDELIAGQK